MQDLLRKESMKLLNYEIGGTKPLLLIAGPCVVESEQLQVDTAGFLKEITAKFRMPFIFKSSYDKANRSSIDSFRGPGIEEGLRILSTVKNQLNVPILTDIHEVGELELVTLVADVLQTPAFCAVKLISFQVSLLLESR